ERAGGRGPAVVADRRPDRGWYPGLSVMPSVAPARWMASIGRPRQVKRRGAAAPHRSVVFFLVEILVRVGRDIAADLRRQHQPAQHLVDLAVRARRLVPGLLGLGIAYQRAQLLAVGLRVFLEQLAQRTVAFGQQ